VKKGKKSFRRLEGSALVKLLKFILIPNINCKRCMTKNDKDLVGFLVSWGAIFLIF
jgi:hypothetical protein